jgi:LysM repeat protein
MPTKSDYEKWQDTINQSKTNKRWIEYDTEIQKACKEFDSYLSNTKNYVALSGTLIKAILWTESGGPDAQMWKIRPMQIGNPGDPGLDSLLSNSEGGELILSPVLKKQITKASANTPAINIRAAIGYLLMRAASYKTVSVADPLDKRITEITVKAGDNPSKIAAANHTTLEMLNTLNPQILTTPLRIGQKVKIQKATMQKPLPAGPPSIPNLLRIITMQAVTAFTAKKLDYCLSLIG